MRVTDAYEPLEVAPIAPSDPIDPIDEVEAAFFADGEALCAQHRAEADELEYHATLATVRAPWWRRLFTRTRTPAFA